MAALALPSIELRSGARLTLVPETRCSICGAEDCGLATQRAANLTTQEKAVIQLVCQGLVNKDIANVLFISTQTVKNHLHNIFEKLGIFSRLELALYALHQGLQS